ncbi:MAG: hypothetical protein ABFD07_20115 [Methanobacterium sp.]
MSVQLVVLSSGEKLICHFEVIEESGRTLALLTKPLAVKEMVTHEGVSYLLLPFLPMKGDTIKVRHDSICVLPVDADPRLAEQYTSQTSNLVIPTGNRIEKPRIIK